MKINPVKVEIIGMIFLLLSLGWQIFFEDSLKNISRDASFYGIERKIDDIWNLLASEHSQKYEYPEKPSVRFDFPYILSKWKYGPSKHEGLERQIETLTIIRAIIFIIGSILIILGKYYAIKKPLTLSNNYEPGKA